MRLNIRSAVTKRIEVIRRIMPKEKGLSGFRGSFTFIPNTLAIMVGIVKIIVSEVRSLIVLFKLLVKMTWYESLVLLMLLMLTLHTSAD